MLVVFGYLCARRWGGGGGVGERGGLERAVNKRRLAFVATCLGAALPVRMHVLDFYYFLKVLFFNHSLQFFLS